MGSTESTLSAMEGSENSPVQHRANRRRRRRETANSSASNANSAAGDDPWWWEIENANLILDQAPNVTYEDSVEQSGAEFSEEFNALLKIGESVTMTSSGNRPNENDNKNRNENVADKSDNEAPSNTKSVENIESESVKEKTDFVLTAAASNNMETVEIGDSAAASGSTTAAVAASNNCESSSSSTREQSLEEFKEELRLKRLARQTAVQNLRDEICSLRKQLSSEQALTRRLRTGEAADVVEERSASVSPAKEIVADVAEIDTDDEDPMSRGRHAIIELANAQLALQLANSENITLRTELGVMQKQVGTLKEVISCCKQMLAVKEEQCNQLKTKLNEIEASFTEREMKIMSDNLRQEYERQLGNIRQLRQLYEERQRVAAEEQENLQRLISIKRDELLAEQEKMKNFEERNQTLVKEVETANNELVILREECNEHKFEKKALKEEMGAVNTLFSQMVMGFNGKNNLDIDRLTTMLEENRTLLNDMATREGNCTDGATLPKLLFELVEQAAVECKMSRSSTPASLVTASDDEIDEAVVADESDVHENQAGVVETMIGNATEETTNGLEHKAIRTQEEADAPDAGAVVPHSDTNNVIITKNTKKLLRKSGIGKRTRVSTTSSSTSSPTTTLSFFEPEVIGKVASAQEIIGNLPKVWKVLMELLSHHKIEQVQFEENGTGEDCYKSVDTPNGPKAELSVSKTYIKLKDLILEKKSLVKETSRLKSLNSHLEYRLNEQEKRLSTVSLELTKTWHLVGKMQRQHRQLHTQEQILRYQLQQKRRLLSELKEELEYCRRKWAAARAKNDESQEQWNDLRREFAKRKLQDASNSAESGYSDSGPASDEEERALVGAVGGGGGGASAVSAVCRRKRMKEMFEHTRKIKRMQSTSPGRAGNADAEIVLRWNSAPPTCGWRRGQYEAENANGMFAATTDRGAIPKSDAAHCSRSKHRRGGELDEASNTAAAGNGGSMQPEERASRIQRLEEQCRSLIQQVLETSDNRERLEIQLCRFQDEIAPVQHAVPLDEFINRKRMTRASSVPVTGSLTPREEEYTRKRSERLERLEEESRQLMSRIKRTSDRGHYLRCSLDRIRRAPSRECSLESNTEDEVSKVVDTAQEPIPEAAPNETAQVSPAEETKSDEAIQINPPPANNKSPLTADEEAYTARRAARLQRLEEESKQLMTRLSRNTERGQTLDNKLDSLHERYGSEEGAAAVLAPTDQSKLLATATKLTIEQRIENMDKISSNRLERLRILEEEGKQLISRLSNTSERGSQMIDRIAKRELARQTQQAGASASKDETADNRGIATKDENAISKDTSLATVLMPTIKNVACSSIVCEELSDRVTITATPSQISAHGAVPKTKPAAQLSASRPKATRRLPNEAGAAEGVCNAETLEDFVKRLRDLPFPSGQGQNQEEDRNTKHDILEQNTADQAESTQLEFAELDCAEVPLTAQASVEIESDESKLIELESVGLVSTTVCSAPESPEQCNEDQPPTSEK